MSLALLALLALVSSPSDPSHEALGSLAALRSSAQEAARDTNAKWAARSTRSREALRKVDAALEEGLNERYPERSQAFEIATDGVPDSLDAARWRGLLSEQANTLENLWTPELTPLERARRDALVARVRVEIILLTAMPRQRWDPTIYVEQAERLVERVVRAPAAERSELLAQLEGVWERAYRGLVNPRSAWSEEAALRVDRIRSQLEAFASLAGADQTREACEAFAAWVREAAMRSGDTLPHMGRLNWEALVRSCSGSSLSSQELHILLLREAARLDGELGSEPQEQREFPLEPSLERATGRSGWAYNLFRNADLIPPFVMKLELAASPDTAPTPWPVSLVKLAWHGRDAVLRFAVHDEREAQDQRSNIELRVPRDVLVVKAMRFGKPGEAFLAGYARNAGSPPALWNRSVVEGWGLYVLDGLLHHPEIAPELQQLEGLRREMIRQRLDETGRLLACLEWHVLGYAAPEVVKGLMRRTEMDEAQAELTVSTITRDPLQGIGALGLLELLALEEAVGDEDGAADPRRRVMRAVIEDPTLRPSDHLVHVLSNGQ